MTIGIYKITCKETGKCYIGQSIDIERRWKGHHKRFPPQSFHYSIVQATSVGQLNEAEIKFIHFFDSHRNGFNKTIGGTSIKTIVVDAETRAKLSAAKKGKTLCNEHRANMSKPRTDEHKANMSKPKTAEHRANMSKPRTDEHRANISAAVKNAHKFQCPHCLRSFIAMNFKQHHGDNCKKRTD